MTDLEYQALIGKKKVMEITSLSETTIWRKERKGEFPRRKQVSAKRVAWVTGEILEWLKQQKTT